MPNDPRIVGPFDDLIASLRLMSTPEGSHYNYGEVIEDDEINWDAVKDLDRPPVIVMWDGEADQDAIHGGETAAGRFRVLDEYRVGVPIRARDGRHVAMGKKVRADLHQRIIGTGEVRTRGASRVLTSWGGSKYRGNKDGGVLTVVIYIRWDHVMGDMTTQ